MLFMDISRNDDGEINSIVYGCEHCKWRSLTLDKRAGMRALDNHRRPPEHPNGSVQQIGCDYADPMPKTDRVKLRRLYQAGDKNALKTVLDEYIKAGHTKVSLADACGIPRTELYAILRLNPKETYLLAEAERQDLQALKPKPHQKSPDFTQALIRFRSKGATYPHLAEVLDMSVKSLEFRVKSNTQTRYQPSGAEIAELRALKPAFRHESQAFLDAVMKCRAKGATTASIATALDMPPKTLENKLRKCRLMQ